MKYIFTDQAIGSENKTFCGGYKFGVDCPHGGKYKEGDEACIDCVNDSLQAMEENNA